jgi:hypothetical protein
MENQRTGGSPFKRLASRLKRHKNPSPATAPTLATSTPWPTTNSPPPPTSTPRLHSPTNCPDLAASTPGSESHSQALNDYDDRQCAKNRYEEAAAELKEAIKRQKGLDFEDLSSGPEGFDDSLVKKKLNAILTTRESFIKDRKGWSKFTHAVECVFTAFSPFAKNFLTVAQNAQSVMSFTPL